MNSKENLKSLWKYSGRHRPYVNTNSLIEGVVDMDDLEKIEGVVYMDDLEKRKQVYGICGECNEPGTGRDW
ncbi:unnamed protein product [Rhizophagus irregularis]|uniref:Uncharacterized protein n=1 Tax=Rhizophagus irregularis TaxID=588596 RepID=A0A2I1F3P2_9GLOM|nr:hypothetical protein RhiirB3_530207 [Rhizophagus irregularis]CAB5370663.1 unnamed protein product [Rhizophagus irregularis]